MAQRTEAYSSPLSFTHHTWLKDRTQGTWLPFHPWLAQQDVLGILTRQQRLCVLKARQLGLTWVVLAWALYRMVKDGITVLLFSQRDEEAKDLASRLSGMHERLPPWLARSVVSNSVHILKLDNGAEAISFPTTGGRSYTAGLVVVDEADHVPDLERLLNAVAPTVADGGQLVLLSSPDKAEPESTFKRIYQAARQGRNGYHPLFLGWQARPGRTVEWHAEQAKTILAQTGSLDDLHQEYPATEAEALAPRSLDKRISPAWLQQCYQPSSPLSPLPPGAPSLPALEVYSLPRVGRQYVLGADPAEGNPTSDDSAATVLDTRTGEECAVLAGKYEPAVFASHVASLARWYNGAGLMVERNNHGHAVLLWLNDHGGAWIMNGHDGRPGWLSSSKGKALLYDACADAFRDHQTVLHSLSSFTQLASIHGATLRAPEGQHDDRADSYALACQGILRAPTLGPDSIGTRPAPARVEVNPLAGMPSSIFGRRR